MAYVLTGRGSVGAEARPIEDYQAGRLGIVPADQLASRNFA